MMQTLAASLAPSLRPFIQPAREAQERILGLASLRRSDRTRSSAPPTLDGELFTDGTNLFVIFVEKLDEHVRYRLGPSGVVPAQGRGRTRAADMRLYLFYIGPTYECESLRTVEAAVNEAFKVTLEASPYRSTKFADLLNEGRTPPALPPAEETAASRVLADRHARTLAIAIKSSGGLLVSDLAKQLPPEAREETDAIRRRLESEHLIEAEIVVVCTKTQAQVARVISRDVLRGSSDLGVKCACGKPIGEERTEEALSITELGRKLLDGNRWLTLLLLDELLNVGVPLGHILIEQQVGGDEVDCLANLSGELVFFELKDKEFSLGNAYSFGAKIGIIRPDHSVIFSTQKVGADAREHFKRAQKKARDPRYFDEWSPDDEESSEVIYIEGIDKMRRGIEELATAIYHKDAVTALGQVLPLASLGSDSVLQVLDKPAETSASHRVASVPPGVPAPADLVSSAEPNLVTSRPHTIK